MSFNILIPDIENKPSGTKDAVITVLTHDWPLNLRNIFYKIKKQFGYKATYQSVYKAVKELCEKKVLTEKDKKYEIDIEWIKNLQSFTDIVETNYYAKEKLQSPSGLKDSKSGEDIIILNFETIFDAEKYLYYFMKTELFKKKNSSVCFKIQNEWRPLFYLRAEYNYYKRLLKKSHKVYILCSGDSYLENLFKKFYIFTGARYKIIKETFPNDLIVFNDYFIEIFIPEKLREKMRDYLKNKDILALLNEVLEKKTDSPIRIIINKDPSLSKEIQNQIIKEFRKN
jgi:hypothetical protein